MSDEVNGPLHPAADAEYLSAAANWLGLAEENTQTWQDFRVPAQDRTDARMTVTVFARLAELNIAMASACGGYQYRQRMEEQQQAFHQRVALPPQTYAPPVQPPSVAEMRAMSEDLDRKLNGGMPARERPAPCECCAAGLMSGRGETCAECDHESEWHTTRKTPPLGPLVAGVLVSELDPDTLTAMRDAIRAEIARRTRAGATRWNT